MQLTCIGAITLGFMPSWSSVSQSRKSSSIGINLVSLLTQAREVRVSLVSRVAQRRPSSKGLAATHRTFGYSLRIREAHSTDGEMESDTRVRRPAIDGRRMSLM
jgi:hypothetical protein